MCVFLLGQVKFKVYLYISRCYVIAIDQFISNIQDVMLNSFSYITVQNDVSLIFEKKDREEKKSIGRKPAGERL